MKRCHRFILYGIILAALCTLAGPASAIQPLWKYPLSPNATFEGNLNILELSDDGQYIAAYTADDNILRYFDQTGKLLWEKHFTAERPPWISSLSIAHDDSSIAVSELIPGCCTGSVTDTTSNRIILFDRNGTILWNYTTMSPPLAVAISPDVSVLYVGTEDRRIILLEQHDAVREPITVDAPVHAFAISGDGDTIVAAGTNPGRTLSGEVSYPDDMFVFNRSGSVLWKFRAGGPNSVAISEDGRKIAVVGGTFGNLHLFDRNGTLLFERSFLGTGTTLSMSGDASLIAVGTAEGSVYGVDSFGRTIWNVTAPRLSRTIAVARDGGNVAFGNGSTVVQVNRNGSEIWEYPTGAWVSGVALSADGRYLGAISDQVYFFTLDTKVSGTQTTAPALTPFRTGPPPAGEAYMFQAGPTTIPPQLCEPLDSSTASPASITINPIGLHSPGEQFLITGTTKLPANQEILVEVMTADFMSLKSYPKNIFGQTGTVRSITDPDGIGRWEYLVNTSGWIPDRYLVQVTPVTDVGPSVTDHFYLLAHEDVTAIRHLPVTVDPVPYHYEGETFPVGGTTTLPPGQELTISLVPGSFPVREGVPSSKNNGTRGVVGKTRVESGNNGVNRWSFNVNATGLDPTTYVIDMYSPSGEHAGQGFFFLDYNPSRVCRILTVPVIPLLTPSRTPTAAALPTGVVIISLCCAGLLISRRLK